MSDATPIRPCRVCGQPFYEEQRWTEAKCWEWIEDCRRWIGEVLHGDHAHWCDEWDGLPVDETSMEAGVCTCWGMPARKAGA